MTRHNPADWTNDVEVPTAEEIERYKAWWKLHGFPDVDAPYIKNRISPKARHIGNLNDPSYQGIPEQQLWLSVLREGLVDLGMDQRLAPTKQQLKLAAVARDWFQGDGEEAYGFRWTCNMLGISPEWFRQQMVKGIDLNRPGQRFGVLSQPHGRRGKRGLDANKTA